MRPVAAVAVTLPAHVFTAFVGVAMTMFAGNVSVKPRLVCAGLFTPLVIVKMSAEGWPTPTGLVANALLKLGMLLTLVGGALPLLLLVLDSVCPAKATAPLLTRVIGALAATDAVTLIDS